MNRIRQNLKLRQYRDENITATYLHITILGCLCGVTLESCNYNMVHLTLLHRRFPLYFSLSVKQSTQSCQLLTVTLSIHRTLKFKWLHLKDLQFINEFAKMFHTYTVIHKYTSVLKIWSQHSNFNTIFIFLVKLFSKLLYL